MEGENTEEREEREEREEEKSLGKLEERTRVWREGRAKMKKRKNMNGGLGISFK